MQVLRRTLPTRSLMDPNKATRLEYRNHANTDVAATFARVRAELPQPANVKPIRRKA